MVLFDYHNFNKVSPFTRRLTRYAQEEKRSTKPPNHLKEIPAQKGRVKWSMQENLDLLLSKMLHKVSDLLIASLRRTRQSGTVSDL